MYILARGEYLGYDWLVIGMLKLLVFIATLQLVKKLPDIINGIFGTQLKWQGGVKGRLGEMIGIGGLAQKAWSSLGTGAKNIAKLGLSAPIAGAYLGANSLYKKNHGEASLRDDPKFRQAKGWLYGARSAVKTGSLLTAYQEYDKASAPPVYTTSERVAARQARIDSSVRRVEQAVGAGKNVLTSAGVINGEYTDANNVTHFVSTADWQRVRTALNDGYNNYGQVGQWKRTAAEAGIYKSHIQGLLDKRNEASENLKSFATSVSGDSDKYDLGVQAGNLADEYFKKGKELTYEDRKFLEENSDNPFIKAALEAMTKASNAQAYLDAYYGDFDGSNVGKIALGNAIAAQESIINLMNTKYEAKKDTMSVVDKDAIEELDQENEKMNLKMNGAIQNNATFAGQKISGGYMTDMFKGLVIPTYKDYGIGDSDYESFDDFVQKEREYGVKIGSSQFAADLRANPIFANTVNNQQVSDSIDFITNVCNNPTEVLDTIQTQIGDDKEFGKFLNNIDPYMQQNAQQNNDFTNKVASLNGGWYKDTDGKWKKR